MTNRRALQFLIDDEAVLTDPYAVRLGTGAAGRVGLASALV